MMGVVLAHAEDSVTLEFNLSHCPGGSVPTALAIDGSMLHINALRVSVSFIVTTEGEVVSPLILESSSNTDALIVLRSLEQWRFRPAVCNGRPAMVEVRAKFVGPRRKLPHPAVYPSRRDMFRRDKQKKVIVVPPLPLSSGQDSRPPTIASETRLF